MNKIFESLVSEAIALPTEPQPLPKKLGCLYRVIVYSTISDYQQDVRDSFFSSETKINEIVEFDESESGAKFS